MFSWASLPRPIIALAPMAGYTDSPFRQIVKEICPRVICFTEFTSVDGILHGNDATMRQIFFNPERERPIVAQIFGKKPENFYKAVQTLIQLGVDAIDINMGCPAKKIISSDHGSALLKNPCLSEEIVRAAVEGTVHADAQSSVPVSVKMRIGTSSYDQNYFFTFAQNMQRAGAKLITIHGRTSKQMYTGTADWQPIYELKKNLTIPVIGNGDIKNGKDALSKIGNLDGIMIGRGSMGNPWVFLEILAAFENASFARPTWEERFKLIQKHMELNCSYKGEKWGILEMRKHFAWYIRGIPHASALRQKLMTVTSRAEALSSVADFLAAQISYQALPQPILA